jgi:nucleotide-binding universal stress UspA family protein
MIRFKHILVPTDFSPAAKQALDYAISLALEHEAQLILLHVIEDISFNAPFTLTSYPVTLKYHEGMEQSVKEALRRTIDPQLRRQMAVEDLLVRGKPFVEIVRVARDKDVDLMVLSTHSHPGPKHSHLGPTADHVIRLSPCPVLLVRPVDFEFVAP